MNSAIGEELRNAEHDINTISSQMGDLKAEYTFNRNNINLADIPRTLPHTIAVYKSNVCQKELEMRIRWLEAKVLTMEKKKAAGTRFIEERDMKSIHQALFSGLVPVFEDVFTEMEGITKDELAILRAYINPPPAVLDTVHMVMLLRGETDTTWESSKVIFSETYFYSFFISKARNHHKHYVSTDTAIGQVDPEQAEALTKFVMTPEHHPDEVGVGSRPCGIFARWISAVYSHYLLSVITQPVPAHRTSDGSDIVKTKEELKKCRQELQQKKDEVLGADAAFASLKQELEERLEELRVRYDDALLPLQEMFFVANKRFDDAYSSPRRERSADPIKHQ